MLAQILEAGFDPGGERRIAGQRNPDAQSGAEHGRLEDAPIMFDHAVEPDLDRVLRELGDIEAEIELDGDGFHDRHDQIVLRFEMIRSEEHTSELQSLMRTSYAVFCLNKKKRYNATINSSIS